MFSPLAYTKTYALASAFVLGLILLPTLAYFLFSVRIDSKMIRRGMNYVLIGMGVALCSIYGSIPALGLTAVISSSIESSLGLTQLARIAAWLTPDTIPGLDTLDLMQAQQVRRWPGSTLPVVEVDALERLL